MGYIYVRVAAAQRNIGDVLVQIRQSDPVRLHKGLQVLANPKDFGPELLGRIWQIYGNAPSGSLAHRAYCPNAAHDHRKARRVIADSLGYASHDIEREQLKLVFATGVRSRIFVHRQIGSVESTQPSRTNSMAFGENDLEAVATSIWPSPPLRVQRRLYTGFEGRFIPRPQTGRLPNNHLLRAQEVW